MSVRGSNPPLAYFLIARNVCDAYLARHLLHQVSSRMHFRNVKPKRLSAGDRFSLLLYFTFYSFRSKPFSYKINLPYSLCKISLFVKKIYFPASGKQCICVTPSTRNPSAQPLSERIPKSTLRNFKYNGIDCASPHSGGN